MKGPNGKPIIRWSFSPSLQISDWSWGSQIDRTFGIPVAQAARTRWAAGRRRGAQWPWDSVWFCGILQLHFCCMGLTTTACHSRPGPPAVLPNSLSILCSTGKPQQLFQTKLPAGRSLQETHPPHERHSPDWLAFYSQHGWQHHSYSQASPAPLFW